MDGVLALQGITLLLLTFLGNIHCNYNLSISTEGSNVVGGELNISCVVQPITDLHDKEVILTLEKLDYAAGSGELLSDSGDTAMLVFSFAPVKIEDRGVYVCSAAVNSMEPLSAELNLTVQFLSAVSLSFEMNLVQPIFIGENITITCLATPFTWLINDINISYDLTAIWKNGSSVVGKTKKLQETGNISKHSFPLHVLITEPSVNLTCEVMIEPNDEFLKGVNSTNQFRLLAHEPPQIYIEHYGRQNIGFPGYSLNCSYETRPEEITMNIVLQWSRSWVPFEDADQQQIDQLKGFRSAMLSFKTLNLEDADVYTCTALVNDRAIALSGTKLLLTTPFNVSIDSSSPFHISISWREPLQPDAPVTNYSIAINISQNQNTVIVPSNMTNYKFAGLNPYQYVGIIIAANTRLGKGEPVSLDYRTDEYIPEPVENFSSTRISNTSVILNWSPLSRETANGIVVRYQLSISHVNESGLTTELYSTDVQANISYAVINGLGPEMRYLADIRAVNSLHEGVSTQLVFYTIQGILPPPTDIEVSKLNATHITVLWTPVDDPRGLVYAYKLMNSMGAVFHALSNNLIIQKGEIYGIRVAVVNGDGAIGPWSQWKTNAGSRIVQLRGGPFKSCTSLNDRERSFIINFIKQSIQNLASNHCNCSTVYITFNGDNLLCDEATPTDIIYRANMTGIGPYYTDDLVEIISLWIMGGATITTGISQITLDSQCPVTIETNSEPICNSNYPTNDHKSQVGLVLGLSLPPIFLCVVISIIVALAIRRHKKTHTWSFEHCPTPEDHPWLAVNHLPEDSWVIRNHHHHQQQQHDYHHQLPMSMMFNNASFEDIEIEEYIEREGSVSQGTEELERESGVYDPSNLTVIYESDHEPDK